MVHLIPSLDGLENSAISVLELAALIALLALFRRRAPHLGLAFLALGVVFAAHTALLISPIQAIFPSVHFAWNWDGKAFSIAVTLLAIALIPSVSWSDAGFRWSQGGGLLPALGAAAVMCAFAWGVELLIVGLKFTVPSAQTLFFQATMPGLNEEPLYRGLILLLIDRAFWGEGCKLLGARVGWGVLLTSVWFGVIHGTAVGGGHFVFDFNTVWIITIMGLLLAWIRVRTGSLAIGVVAHNIVNIGSSFIG